jgi:hypothetical protein
MAVTAVTTSSIFSISFHHLSTLLTKTNIFDKFMGLCPSPDSSTVELFDRRRVVCIRVVLNKRLVDMMRSEAVFLVVCNPSMNEL